MLARLWHAPSMDGASSDAVGTACIGSSEAIMLGGELQARNRSHTWLAAEYAKCCMGRLHWQLGTSMLSRTGAGAVLPTSFHGQPCASPLALLSFSSQRLGPLSFTPLPRVAQH